MICNFKRHTQQFVSSFVRTGCQEKRRAGIIKPSYVVQVEATRRVKSFKIDDYCPFDFDEDDGCQKRFLDLDKVLSRFLLVTHSRGGLFLYDTKPDPVSKPLLSPISSSTALHAQSIECVRWFPNDNGMFTTSGLDGQFCIIDMRKFQIVQRTDCKFGLFTFDITPDGRVAVALNNGHISLLKLGSPVAVESFASHRGTAICCAWSPLNDYHLLTGGRDGNINFFDTRHLRRKIGTLNQFGECIVHECDVENLSHNGRVNYLRYFENGSGLVSFGTDRKVKIWIRDKLDQTIFSQTIPPTHWNYYHPLQVGLVENSKPKCVFVPRLDRIDLFELGTGKRINTLYNFSRPVISCYYNEQYQELYSTSQKRVLRWTSRM